MWHFNTLELSQHHPKSLIKHTIPNHSFLGALNAHHKVTSSMWKIMISHWLWVSNFWAKLLVNQETNIAQHLAVQVYLTHPRLGNQPLTLHGSADLANVSPILKGTPASITWGFVLGFVYRFRGIRHSIQWSKTSKVLSPPAYHAPQVTTLPSCRGQGVLSIIYLLWW